MYIATDGRATAVAADERLCRCGKVRSKRGRQHPLAHNTKGQDGTFTRKRFVYLPGVTGGRLGGSA